MFSSPTLAEAAGWSGNANLFLGGKFMDSNDWSPAQDQFEAGLLLDVEPPPLPLSLAADFLFGFSSGAGVDVQVNEYDLGVRKIFEIIPLVHPYLGGGVSIETAELSAGSASIDETGVGYWVEGGVMTHLLTILNLGLDLRYSSADVNFSGVTLNSGGIHVGLITGLHW
jgi:opacity protein-like surface antigen